jgi:uncharacterized protein YxjI
MRYLVREKIFAIKDDFWVTDESGNKVFRVDAKLMSMHDTLELKDAGGANLAVIKKKLVSIHDTMEIEHDHRVVATVGRKILSPIEHRYHIDVAGEGRWEAVGDFIQKEYEIRSNRGTVAYISRRWFTIRDAYGVDVGPGENEALIIAIAICIDRIHHREEEQHNRR